MGFLWILLSSWLNFKEIVKTVHKNWIKVEVLFWFPIRSHWRIGMTPETRFWNSEIDSYGPTHSLTLTFYVHPCRFHDPFVSCYSKRTKIDSKLCIGLIRFNKYSGSHFTWLNGLMVHLFHYQTVWKNRPELCSLTLTLSKLLNNFATSKNRLRILELSRTF